ncbi:DNA-binding transcriptional MerR regulator [Micromonospora echinospora]|uniref:DNA-binding transcriptional MerR regulator n=1 Tax=Micromonospora echinospora TaxID=1877 RepID=A0ABR6MF55_MICEC|nr:HEAT repeat domain-containing protein [Micromonospora echinospora]MBB5114018.1 DNA-binding transcriptional MerR regulator [Micromonospora echinospora]
MLIGEVARRSGVSARMLRHYDSLGLVRPTGRTSGGYREYTAEDVRRIFHVESLRSLGLSLGQIRRALADPDFAPSVLVGDLIRQSEDRLGREQELLKRLRAVDDSAPAGWHDVLRIVALLHGLTSPNAARRQQAVLSPAGDVPASGRMLAEAVLAESDPHVADTLRWALARAGDDALAGVASGAYSEDVEVRRRAVRAIAAMPGAEASALLAAALDDQDPGVRGHAALSLGTRGETTAVPTLVAMVADGVNDVEAGEILGKLAREAGCGERIMDGLTGRLHERGADPAVRIRLAQALAEMPAALARDALERLAKDDDPTLPWSPRP